MKHKIEIEGDVVYLKKSKLFGWTVIHPNTNEDGSINWFNFITGGNWVKFIIMIFIILIILGCIYEYASVLNLYNMCREEIGVIQLIDGNFKLS